MEERVMDTVFHVYDPATDKEEYLLKEWGGARMDEITVWIARLKQGIKHLDHEGNDVTDPCPYDLDNLKWSGKAIMNSITLELWETIEKDLGADADGPEVFGTIISKLQQVNAASVRALVDKLKTMSLINEPGQNVDTFGDNVIVLCRRIVGTGAVHEV